MVVGFSLYNYRIKKKRKQFSRWETSECQLKVTVSVFFGWTLRGDKIKRKVFDEGILYIRDLIYHT